MPDYPLPVDVVLHEPVGEAWNTGVRSVELAVHLLSRCVLEDA